MSTKYDDGSDMDFMYPRMLPMAGHLHMIYNALEESFGKSEWGKQFMDNLRVIENLLSGREPRRRLIETCIAIPAEKRLVESHLTVLLDRRWEFLSRALDCLIPRLSTFQ